MKNVLFSCFAVLAAYGISFAQPVKEPDSLKVEGSYPYRLPFLGQKAFERGYGDQLQLPLGVNINHVNAYIELGITEFELTVGGKDFTDIINAETLNFQEVSATTNGLNWRADAWVLPFMNVYGLFSAVRGGTAVTLQPTWRDASNNIILQLPAFSSEVEFDAIAYGIGTTLVFGWDNYFLSSDLNYSATSTELLNQQVGYLTVSARAGYRINFKNKPEMFFAPYFGMMYRDFVGSNGNDGSINFDEVFPGLEDELNTGVDGKVQSNEDEIAGLNPITDAGEIAKLLAQNIFLRDLQERANESEIFTTEINYFIQKEMIQAVTVQLGFNFQFNKHWALRGEYGVSGSQRFLLTGLQYRFGIPKK